MTVGHRRMRWWKTAIVLVAAQALVIPSHLRAQSIFTVAGGGPIGDGKLATDALLREPNDVVSDAAGNLYIADTTNHRIRRVDAQTGIITTYAGGGTSGLGDGGPATEAEIRNPVSIALDKSGDLYVAHEDRVRRIARGTGIITTFAGGGPGGDGSPATEASFGGTSAIAFDPSGNLYIAGAPGGSHIHRVDSVTGILTIVIEGEGFSPDGTPASEARLRGPEDIAFDREGNLHIAERGSYRVRRIDSSTGLLSTVAGTGEDGSGPYGFPATESALRAPAGLAFDGEGNLYISEGANHILRVDHETRILTEAVGGGIFGDGGPATDTFLSRLQELSFDSRGNLLIAENGSHRIRRVSAVSGIVDTVAGGGPIGDGMSATVAQLAAPWGIATDSSGNLYIADRLNYRIRRVEAATGVVSTIAGTDDSRDGGDGGPAAAATMREPVGIDVDKQGNLYVAAGGRVRRIDGATGIIETFAGLPENCCGGFSGDGGPATLAKFQDPRGLAVDSAANVYIADWLNNRIRKVDASTGIVDTFAGSGPVGESGVCTCGSYSGDGGPATEATLDGPQDVAIAPNGDLYIADTENHRVRKVDAATGIISTVAGTGNAPSGYNPDTGDGGPATQADLYQPRSVALDTRGNLYIAATENTLANAGSRVQVVDAVTGIITSVAGAGHPGGFTGDHGPASASVTSVLEGLAIDASGNVFISDTGNNRIRAVFACVDVPAATLVSPANGAIDVPTAPTLSWEEVKGAFRYDVLLSREGATGIVAASDLTSTTFTPQNLVEGAKYFWRIRARGDPFCDPVSESLSAIRTFVVIPPCEAPPPPTLTSPAEAFVVEDFSTTLTWSSVPRVSSYDIYLGTSVPPQYLRSTTTTSFPTPRLIPGNTYYWSVTAHASCDTSLTTPSEIRSFFLAGPCDPAGEFALLTPANGAFNIPTTTTLTWSSSANATSYDLYLGTTNPPAIFLPGMRDTSVKITGFDPLRTYYWRVKANIACDDAKSRTSEIRSFTTQDTCERPQGTSIVFTPPGAVGVGQIYAIAWNRAPGLDPGGTYIVERSIDPGFSTLLDSQELTDTTATFIAESSGLHYHRVRPVPRCNPSLSGSNSSSASVNIVNESANIIFTVEPEAVVSRTGRKLEDLETRFTIENISKDPVQVIVGRAEIQSVPFFTIVDPFGGDAVFVTLQPRQPKTFAVRFSGPPNDIRAAYQGLVVLNAVGSPIIPYAFVNLKVGDQSGASPEFRISSTPSEYTFFPGFDGDDEGRPPITVEIHNPGSSPVELGAEIGPEVWLEPEAGWNSSAIAAGATRSVDLITRRNRALNGSALPRYTFFTVRTKTGESARLLVQDNAASSIGQGRTSALSQDDRSFIIPDVVSEFATGGSLLVSRIRVTNLGSDTIQAELVYTPSGSDGFSASVQRAIVVVPPNDVATLTDPLVQIFGLVRPATGQIEVRASGSRLGSLSVESSFVTGDRADSSYVRIPTVLRNDGARIGSPHQIAGISANDDESTRLVLAETSGTDGARVALTLYDSAGVMLGSDTVDLDRYGHLLINDLVSTLGGTPPLSAGRLTITVTGEGGSVIGLARIEDAEGERASVLQSAPLGDGFASKQIRWSDAKRGVSNGVTTTLVAPWVASGDVSATGVEYSTVMGFQAPFGLSLDFTVTFTNSSGQTFTKVVPVLAGAIVEFSNVIAQLFGINEVAEGSIVIEGDTRGLVYSRLMADGLPAGAFDLVSSISELVTMASSSRPLYVDGVEQSTDPSRGTRWNLHVREIAGQSGVVTIRLYEAGNRTHPIAIKDFNVTARGQLSLETIFDAMDLNTDSRRKDRTNVLCMITPKSGQAQIAGVALEIDNRTGSATPHTLQPASGLPASGVTNTLVRVVETGSSKRRRPIRRGE